MGTDEKIKISIIMPVYNRAHVLPRSVRSVLNQTLREIELVCINDGSTDDSVRVLKRLAHEDPRIRVLSQRNAGSGPARNHGLKRAKGEFIAFLDSDDWYASDDVLEKLYETAVEQHVKVCLGGSRNIDHGKLLPLEEPGKVYFTKNALISYEDYQYPYGYWRGIYERRMLLDNEIYFPDYRRYQDPPFFVNAMICAERFYALTTIVLIYDRSTNYQSIRWDERKTTDLLEGIRDVVRMAQKQSYVQMQKDVIKDIKVGRWHQVFRDHLRREWIEAQAAMQEANDYFLESAMRQYGLPKGEKPFDRLLRDVFGNSIHSKTRKYTFYIKEKMKITESRYMNARDKKIRRKWL